MASDNVSLTFRVSPEVLKLIDSQPGSTRTERFERLIYSAYEELPRAKNELKRVNADIERERGYLRSMRDSRFELVQNVNALNRSLSSTIASVDHVFTRISGLEVPDHG